MVFFLQDWDMTIMGKQVAIHSEVFHWQAYLDLFLFKGTVAGTPHGIDALPNGTSSSVRVEPGGHLRLFIEPSSDRSVA